MSVSYTHLEIVSPSLDELKEHYHHILTLLGEDPEREGLLKTPERVAKDVYKRQPLRR